MRALLRNRKTGLYYASCEQWVPDPSRALDFDKIEHPGLLAFGEGVSGLEVVLRYEDSNCELALPIRLEWHGGELARVAA